MTPDEAIQERQALALERIANALDRLIADAAAERDALAVSTCDHPPTEREDRGSTMGTDRWRCKLCGYEHVAPRRPRS